MGLQAAGGTKVGDQVDRRGFYADVPGKISTRDDFFIFCQGICCGVWVRA